MVRRGGVTEIDTWVSDLPDAYITCRDLGHTWRPFRAWWSPEDNCYKRVLRCGRCKTERDQDLASDGMVLSNRYAYSEGYQVPKGTGRFGVDGRANLRLESTLRLIGKDEQ